MSVLGTVPARDSATPPDVHSFDAGGLPFHLLLALLVTYMLGVYGWHWTFIAAIFWMLVQADEQRRRTLWIRLHAAASAAAAASKPDESVSWLNQIFRAIWQMYEPSLAKYALSILQPKVTNNMPRGIGVTNVTLKSFSFGALEARRGDGRHRIAPIVLERVVMVGKSLEPGPSRDPRRERIRYVFRTDVRWMTGRVTLLVLEVRHLLFPFDALDAEVSDLLLEGTLQVELDFVRAYPWLGTIAFAFVQAPSIDFKLSLAHSVNLMELVPKLRHWLKHLIESTINETMVGENKVSIPLSVWYGDEKPEAPPNTAERPTGSPHRAAATAAAAAEGRRAHGTAAHSSNEGNKSSWARSPAGSGSGGASSTGAAAGAVGAAAAVGRGRGGCDGAPGAQSSTVAHPLLGEPLWANVLPGASSASGVSGGGHGDASTAPAVPSRYPPSAASPGARASAQASRVGNFGGEGGGEIRRRRSQSSGMAGSGSASSPQPRRSSARSRERAASGSSAMRGLSSMVPSPARDASQVSPASAPQRSIQVMSEETFFGTGPAAVGAAERWGGDWDWDVMRTPLATYLEEDALSCGNGSSKGGLNGDSNGGEGSRESLHGRRGEPRQRQTANGAAGHGAAGHGAAGHGSGRNAHRGSPVVPSTSGAFTAWTGSVARASPAEMTGTAAPPTAAASAAAQSPAAATSAGASSEGGDLAAALASAAAWMRSTPALLSGSGAAKPGWLADARVLRAVRAQEMARGAVGELFVHVTHIAGLRLEQPASRLAASLAPTLASSVYVSLAVGDGVEEMGKAIDAGAGAPRGVEATTLSVGQYFRLCVHDSLTQLLRVRLSIKELGRETKDLGTAELSLADLRVNAPVVRAVPLSLVDSEKPGPILHLSVTYRLLTPERGDG